MEKCAEFTALGERLRTNLSSMTRTSSAGNSDVLGVTLSISVPSNGKTWSSDVRFGLSLSCTRTSSQRRRSLRPFVEFQTLPIRIAHTHAVHGFECVRVPPAATDP
eukprot:2167327-Pleurochrysis_carterae.AAC.1